LSHTSDEGTVGKGYLSKFQELETVTPVIVTTSQLLTTGVDIPTCKNIVIARVVSSMVEFKQIIGRGTRVRDDYGKYYFNILDYTASATRLFADPDFDGEPVLVTEQEMTETGETITEVTTEQTAVAELEDDGEPTIADDSEGVRRKYYFDSGQVEISAHLVYELDPDGRQLRVVRFSEYASEKVPDALPFNGGVA
jgi:type I restriction enzyme, R subunit